MKIVFLIGALVLSSFANASYQCHEVNSGGQDKSPLGHTFLFQINKTNNLIVKDVVYDSVKVNIISHQSSPTDLCRDYDPKLDSGYCKYSMPKEIEYPFFYSDFYVKGGANDNTEFMNSSEAESMDVIVPRVITYGSRYSSPFFVKVRTNGFRDESYGWTLYRCW